MSNDSFRDAEQPADHSPEWGEPLSTNPYRSPLDSASTDQHTIAIEPEVLTEESGGRRVWSSVLVVFASLAVFLVTSGVMAAVSVYVVHGELTLRLLRDPAAMEKVTQSRIGLVILVVIPQLAMVTPSILAALLSPVRTRRRLGLVRGHWPLWGWVAAAFATPLVGLISSVVVGSFMQESDSLKTMSSVFRGHGTTGFLIPLALMIGATPAICEELLFRGYVQTRLVKAWGPGVGIFIASVLFAVFHIDLVHVIAVLPLGLFLGFVAWRSGSLLPAMAGHFVNNVFSVVAVVLAPEDQNDITLAMPVAIMSLSIMALGFLGTLAVIAASIAYPDPNKNLPTPLPIADATDDPVIHT
ncbi:CPBP family intramembrane glutamic endopeptidase [Stieleria varia]|uniref:CAAX amino terminal protease self-immunity n=1 Tax=Stieleria varia TaxID=2528005 RepID=A0A5C6B1Q8_9BACT|nr:CPBP family intramembrane glutamic endopeptidase [Stieleria varia]TWU05838.1 CAAX amino terminal protease self- immunity [Stieleria varia]